MHTTLASDVMSPRRNDPPLFTITMDSMTVEELGKISRVVYLTSNWSFLESLRLILNCIVQRKSVLHHDRGSYEVDCCEVVEVAYAPFLYLVNLQVLPLPLIVSSTIKSFNFY